MGDKKKSYLSQAIDLDLKIQDAELIENYTDLRVYKLAFESAIHIFEISRKWPAEEKYSLTDQIRRSSRSVCANIAEAWRKRRYPAHFVSKLSDSDSEAAETEVWLDFALRLVYLSKYDPTELRDHYDHICRMLTNMIANPQLWCRRAKVEKRKA
ncbi:four helix bundle protein [candidate division KSB1 bacterium]|nr:four helix bundle protein [candidate division KSB1 bacterium]MCH8982401.1 four helix bundle protein [candidate division KSB1 bacterium]